MNQSYDVFSKTPNGSYGISDYLLIYNEENEVIAGPFFTEKDAVAAARPLAKQSGQRVYCWGKMCWWSMDPDGRTNEGNPFVKRRGLGNPFTSWKR